AGLETTTEGSSVYVRANGVEPYDLVRDAVVDLGLGLVRIQQRRHTLEDLFRIEASEERAEVAS
ncbi:MAG: ABC transporter ATP-binding protein, partial [Dehalococcoidia bacterium]|nr:ABC transporter ATP-binding protein [Dehalococcoidia bacterium]